VREQSHISGKKPRSETVNVGRTSRIVQRLARSEQQPPGTAAGGTQPLLNEEHTATLTRGLSFDGLFYSKKMIR